MASSGVGPSTQADLGEGFAALSLADDWVAARFSKNSTPLN